MTLIQKKSGGKFDIVNTQLIEGRSKQNEIITTSDSLVLSLQTALTALNISQQKHETAITNNEAQLQAMLQKNQKVSENNADLEKLPRWQYRALSIQEERHRALSQQAEMMKQQWNHNHQMGVRGQATMQVQKDLAEMRERNRCRANGPSQSSTCVPIVEYDSLPGRHPPTTLTLGPKEPTKNEPPGINHSNRMNRPANSPFQATQNPPFGFTPMPCAGFPNMVADPCPAFTPSTFQN